MEPAISFRRVVRSFGDKRVLRGVDLEIGRGETVAILGGSGTGKTVTLKLINGLLHPDSGSITVLSEPVSELDERQLLSIRLKVSYLFQGGALFDSMNVFDNIAFPVLEHGSPSPGELEELVEELLAMVELEGTENLFPSELSGGMRKRAALARALALRPEIILYDEPTTGLDPLTGKTIADLIRSLHERLGVTSVVVTHDIPLVVRVATRIVFLHEGRFIYSGTPDEAAREGPERVRQFFAAGGLHA